jgi:hypothetical protein
MDLDALDLAAYRLVVAVPLDLGPVAVSDFAAAAMKEPTIRELRETDIRCREIGCGAGPGESCNPGPCPGGVRLASNGLLMHKVRVDEHDDLVADGWQWQEVDPRDAGARG